MNNLKAIREKINEINDRIETEKREATAEEAVQLRKLDREYTNALRENQEELMQQQRENMKPKEMATPLTKLIREAGNNETIKLSMSQLRETTTNPSGEGATYGALVKNIGSNMVENQIQPILEPLYANRVIGQLGVRTYSGLPMGNIVVPKMGKGAAAWVGEAEEAANLANTFDGVTLTPFGLAAKYVISKKMLAQDTVGVNDAIKRDLVNALYDQLEATIFGAAAGTAAKPAGIFNGKTISANTTTFKGLADLESDIELANVPGGIKYLLSPKAKADIRTMTKTEGHLVMDGGTVDGTAAVTTSNVGSGKFVIGAWDNLAVGIWDNVEITVDPYTLSDKGCVRVTILGFFDAKVLRSEAFAFGKTR